MKRDFPTFLLYVFGFLLLWEWLRPVELLTDTGSIRTFIVFMLICFLVSYVQLKKTWQWLIKVVYILGAVNRLHYKQSIFQPKWFLSFITDTGRDLGKVAGRNWDGLSNEFRTLLFFILLWIMVYLIHYWLLRLQRMFLFVFMTLVYITVLDTFTPYSANWAIVRTVVIGFAVMGMLTYNRLARKEHFISDGFMRRWMVPLAGMIAISVLIGLAAPKAAPIWPDPVPYLTAANDKGGTDGKGTGPSRIGYGTNDERLGGPFIGDSSPVFMYEANGKHYWKVETKDRYTGKGWVPSSSAPIDYREGDPVPVYSIPATVEKTKRYGRVYFNKNYHSLRFILYPAGIETILSSQSEGLEPNLFRVDTALEKITSYSGDISFYTIEYSEPKYKAIDLRKTTEFNQGAMDVEFYKQYTKLPPGLPSRIKQLTEKITAGKTNWFDKAKAVESYFGNGEYTYDQKNVAVPGKNDDYVDQFLFETKRGYCDNFSSSMAVMLRSIGIPTRWVKGFTGGDFMKYSSSGGSAMQLYQVTNNNAHSWVEVFIPGQGWVPFEPTKGFSNDVNIDYSTGQTSSSSQTSAPAAVNKPVPQKKIEDTAPVKKDKSSMDFQSIWSKTLEFFRDYYKKAILYILVILAAAYLLYRIRGKWAPYLWLVCYRFRKEDTAMVSAYMILLKQLSRYGLKRKKNQTLRNYAQYVDSFFSTHEMTSITQHYEQYLYHHKLPEGSWQEARKLWENLIKKTIA